METDSGILLASSAPQEKVEFSVATKSHNSKSQCVICLVALHHENDGGYSSNLKTNNTTDVDNESEDTITTTDDNEESLLKLLQVKITTSVPTPFENRENGTYYCQPCMLRNETISHLFSQIDDLHQHLSNLKDAIEFDFKNSLRGSHPSGVNGIKEEEDLTDIRYNCGSMPKNDLFDRKDFLRYHFAKSFNILNESSFPLSVDSTHDVEADFDADPVDSQNAFEIENSEDDWEPNIVPNVAYSDSDSNNENDNDAITEYTLQQSHNSVPSPSLRIKQVRSFPKDITDLISTHGGYDPIQNYSHLKKLYGITKDLVIRIDRLPSHILLSACSDSKNTIRKNRSKNITKSEPNSRLSSTVYKCIFADCDNNELFYSVKERDQHVDAVHGQVRNQLPSSKELRSSKLKSNRQPTENAKFKCLFNDCQSGEIFHSLMERNRHIELVHDEILESSSSSSSWNPSKSKSKSKLKSKSKASVTEFKCIFDDCGTNEVFYSIRERDNHVELVHDHVVDSSSSSSQQNLSKAKSNLKSKGHVKLEKTEFKCIFDDCKNGKVFASEKERDNHVKLAHHKIVESSSSSEEEDFSNSKPTKDSRRQFMCMFADCTTLEYFKTDEEMHAHIKSVHGINTEGSDDGNVNEDDDNGEENESSNSGDKDGGPSSPNCSTEPEPKVLNRSDRSCRKKSLIPSRFQCIFADCSSQEIFHTLKDRDKHVQMEHGDTLKPKEPDLVEKLVKHSLANRKRKKRKINSTMPPKPRLHCFVEGCKSRRYFASEAEREMHMKKIHEGVTHPFECSECGRKYRSNQEHELHVKSVHLGEFPHICHFCGKGFTSIANLNAHIPKHTQERNFKCELCLQTFKTQSGLVYHRRAIHMGEVERSHRCDRCGKGFFTFQKLNNHIKCVHNKDEKPVICEICGKRFAIRNYLYMHMRTHGKQAGSNSSGGAGSGAGTDVRTIEPDCAPTKSSSFQNKKKPKSSFAYNLPVSGQAMDSNQTASATSTGEEHHYPYQSHQHNPNHSSVVNPASGRFALESQYTNTNSNLMNNHDHDQKHAPSNLFNPHSNSNSNMSTASSCTPIPSRPGSTSTVPVDLSHYHPPNQLHAQFSSHSRSLNVPRFFHGDMAANSQNVNVSNHSGHLSLSNSNANLPNFMAMSMAPGSSSSHQSPQSGSNVLPIQVPQATAALQHQYLQIMNNFDNLNGFHTNKF